MKITNITKAPQGLNTTTGVVYLQPGETREGLQFSDAESSALSSNPNIAVDGKAPDRITPVASPAPAGAIEDTDGDGVQDSPDRDTLKARASELGIDFPKNIPTDKLKGLVDTKTAEQKTAQDAAAAQAAPITPATPATPAAQ